MTTTDIVPATNMAELDTLDPQAREVAMLGMLEQAHTWLAHAVETSAPARDIADFKAFIATASDAAKRLKVSKEIQVDAEVMVRRSERALGQSIRGGQESGEISKKGDAGDQGDYIRGGRPVRGGRLHDVNKTSPGDFFAGGRTTQETYAMTDDVTDEDFETALTEAKDEGNVSRANVVRKIKAPKETTYSEQHAAKWERIAALAKSGSASSQIAREVGMSEAGVKSGAKDRGIDIRADRVLGRVHRLDSNRIIRESVSALENIISGLDLINPDDIDPEEAQKWIDSLTASRNALSKAIRQIEKRKSIQ